MYTVKLFICETLTPQIHDECNFCKGGTTDSFFSLQALLDF